MATSERTDPPAGVHSLWRLRGYLRPHVRALSVMAAAAVGAVGLTITIPLVTKAIIDGPIADRDLGACSRSACWRSGSACSRPS